ncbi:hypothetical protein HK097_001666 [Rhizophlyctis rosea]|uniref:Defective in cullin neddylation protein n=1 Tax=Rhizophlyctis rosea TaxID=64517 RepID=A0AAD5SC43_9FUNG|nr:hypothetical protein HK097_001666 [Rhizophlyctis rosea]
MPPKRKAATTTTKTNAAKAPATNKKQRTSGTSTPTTRSPKSRNAEVEITYAHEDCRKWFAQYRDEDRGEEEYVGPEGLERLCEDLKISLQGLEILVLAWKLGAARMGFFTKAEWLHGMRSLGADSTPSLHQKLPSFRGILQNETELKKLYDWAFTFAKEGDQKNIGIDHGMYQPAETRFLHVGTRSITTEI